MNTSDFQTWLAEHDAYFPGVDGWIGKQRDRTLEIWRETLGFVSLKAALAASKAMYEDTELQPKGFGHHAVEIRRLAISFSSKVIDAPVEKYVGGQRVYSCLACSDSANRIVVHPKTMAAIRGGTFRLYGCGPGVPLMTCAVWCSQCNYARTLFDAQQARKTHSRVVEFVAYDPARMVLAEGAFVENVTAAFAFAGVELPDLTPPERAVHEDVRLIESAKPLASLLAASKAVSPAVAQASDGRFYDESEAAAEGPWTPDMDIPF